MRKLMVLSIVAVFALPLTNVFTNVANAETTSTVATSQDIMLNQSNIQVSTTETPKLLTRGEMCKFFAKAMGIYDPNATSSFIDVPASSEYNHDISSITNAGIIQGYPDGHFYPERPLTRAEYATVLIKAFRGALPGVNNSSLSIKDVGDSWYKDSVLTVVNAGLMKVYDDGTFRPDQEMDLDTNSQLFAKVTPFERVKWSSSNPNVAMVDETGYVTGKSTGQAIITAKTISGNLSKTCSVTVTDNSEANSTTPITPASTEIQKTNTQTPAVSNPSQLNSAEAKNNNNNHPYVVQHGDTLYKISIQNRTTVQELIRANNLNSTIINIGQELLIPTTYTVTTGDTMYLIANKLGLPLSELIQANPQINDPSSVLVGQLLYVPQKMYEVASGDSMLGISIKFGISLNQLIAENPQVKDPNSIQIGQILYIPQK